TQPLLACRSHKLDGVVTGSRETYENQKAKPPPSEADGKWAGSRETNLDSGRGRTFVLTSPFIELIDGVLSAMAFHERADRGSARGWRSQSGFFVVASVSASMTTSTSAPTLRRAFLPFSSVTTFSTRISRYSSSASSIPICAFSGSLGRAGSITFCTLPRIFRFLLLMGNLQLEGRASRFYTEVSLQGEVRVERQPCPGRT